MIENAKNAGLPEIDQLFYNRMKFKFPELQQAPHTNWDDEVTHLENIFPGGSAYVVGKTNSATCHWYCYLWGDGKANKIHECLENNDYTIEILMTGLAPENEGLFAKAQGMTQDGKSIITELLYTLYDDVKIDDYLFDPCGYSCNGYPTTKGSNYFTVHVTPEEHCSYASFESNFPSTDLQTHQQLVLKVINIFKPSRFTVCLFAEKDEFEEEVLHEKPCQNVGIATTLNGHWKRRDRIFYEFENYDLAYYQYEKF